MRRAGLVIALGLGLCAAPISAYEEPVLAGFLFDPAAVVLGVGSEDRVRDVLLSLAVLDGGRRPAASSRALSLALRIDPDSADVQAANRAFLDDRAGSLSSPIKEAEPTLISEIWRAASTLHDEALNEDEKTLALYLMSVVVSFAENEDPRFARARGLLKKRGGTLWSEVLPAQGG